MEKKKKKTHDAKDITIYPNVIDDSILLSRSYCVLNIKLCSGVKSAYQKWILTSDKLFRLTDRQLNSDIYF